MLKLFKFIPKDLLIDNNSSINTDIMNFLSIDCSTETGSLFVKAKNKTFIKVLQSDKFTNDLLVKQILDFLVVNDLKFDDISHVFVNQGPGNFNKKDSISSLIKFREKYYIKKFNKNLNSVSKIEEITEDVIIKKYNNKFKVIPKNASKHFSEKILKLNNLSIVDLNHNELEFLQLKGLLNKDLIKPLYLS